MTTRLRSTHTACGATALAAALLVCLACAASAPGERSSGAGTAQPATRATAPALERQVFEQINRERTKAGLAPLHRDDRLDELAREHSVAMANGRRRFGHKGFEKRARAMEAWGVVASAENVASSNGPDPAADATRGWISSRSHRRNLLGAYELTGVGAARAADGSWYLTQLYARPAP